LELKNILSKVNMDISKDTEQMIQSYILMALNACGVDERKAEHHAKVATKCIMFELGDKLLGEGNVE
jgi:hypothetical protein